LLGLVAFGGHETILSNDKENASSGVDSEVKRLPFRGALLVSVTLLVRPCQRKTPEVAGQDTLFLVWNFFI